MLGLQKNLAWRLQRSSTLPAQCPLHATCSAPPRHQYINQRVLNMAATQQHQPHRHMLAAAAPAASSEQQLHAEVVADNAQEQQQAEQVNDDSNNDEEEEGTSTEAGFVELGISKLFMAGLARSKITSPAPIQTAAIGRIMAGRNCAIQSYTGSGKTLAYLLPAMTLAFQRAEALYKQHGHRPEGWTVQVLVVAPSQELCMQIVRVAQSLLPDQARTAVQQCIGGANPWRQKEALALHKPLVVVGTPGRLAEMVRSGALQLHQCPLLVLDEADQLLAPHFTEDLLHISTHAGKRVEAGRQTIAVSATLSETVITQLDRYCPSPEFVSLGAAPRLSQVAGDDEAGDEEGAGAPGWGWGATGWEGRYSAVAPRTESSVGGAEAENLVPTMPPNLQHVYMVVESQHKVDALRRCVHALGAERALVFMNWQQRLKDAQFKLEARGMEVASMHGELGKLQRQQTLESFRRGKVRALLVSDVAARGLDVAECDAVFHLELPSNAAHYAHRAGRTGRMGAPGTVVTIASPSERFVVDKLAEKLRVPILEGHLSHGKFILGPPPPEEGARRAKRPRKQEAARDGAEATSSDAPQEAASHSKEGHAAGVHAKSSTSVRGSKEKQQQEASQDMGPDEDDAYDSDDDDDAPIKLPPGFGPSPAGVGKGSAGGSRSAGQRGGRGGGRGGGSSRGSFGAGRGGRGSQGRSNGGPGQGSWERAGSGAGRGLSSAGRRGSSR